MKITVEKTTPAWQPLTPQGVAAFAYAKAGRLFLAQSIVALLAAVVVVWFFHQVWFPTVREAIRQLPAQGEIRGGQLQWVAASPQLLAEGTYLSLVVDLAHTRSIGQTSHVQVEFGRSDVRICGLLGCLSVRYPEGWIVAFNRSELEPWWGSREPVILGGIFAGVWIALMASWQILATLYCLPVRLMAFIEKRDLNLGQSWRLAGAALMPGAVFFALAIAAYGLNLVDVIRLLLATGMHVVLGWLYAGISPMFLPHKGAQGAGIENPFATDEDRASGADKPAGATENPFGGGSKER